MILIRRAFVLALALMPPLVCVSCSTISETDEKYITDLGHVALESIDQPNQRHFTLKATAFSDKICIQAGSWPNEFGQISFGSDNVNVKTPTQTFPLKKRNLGHCRPEVSCAIELHAGETIEAIIPYSEFEGNLTNYDNKLLEYSFEISSSGCGPGKHYRFNDVIPGFMKVE